jgi:hypothetical protein
MKPMRAKEAVIDRRDLRRLAWLYAAACGLLFLASRTAAFD